MPLKTDDGHKNPISGNKKQLVPQKTASGNKKKLVSQKIVSGHKIQLVGTKKSRPQKNRCYGGHQKKTAVFFGHQLILVATKNRWWPQQTTGGHKKQLVAKKIKLEATKNRYPYNNYMSIRMVITRCCVMRWRKLLCVLLLNRQHIVASPEFEIHGLQ